VLRPRVGYIVLAFTVFAAVTVGVTSGVLLRGFQSSATDALADKQALILQGRAHVLAEEISQVQVQMMQLAQSAGVDLADANIEPEKRAVALTATQSAAFSINSAILDLSGKILWSEPGDASSLISGAALVRNAITEGRATISVAREEIDVAVPVANRGAIIAIVRTRAQDLLGPRSANILRESGHISLIRRGPPAEEVIASAGERVPPELSLDRESQRWLDDASGKRWLVTEYNVTEDPRRIAFRLVQSAEELERDGTRRFHNLVGIVIIALVLAIAGGVFFALAIGRLESAQLELVKARELAAVGKTSMAVAHELKNSLNGLSVAIDLLATRCAPGTGMEAVHAQARQEISRLRGVADDLTLFSARPQLEQRGVDLNGTCRSAVEHLREFAKECGAETELALSGEPVWVYADEPKLVGALQSVVRNGLEAMGPGAYGEPLGSTPARRERRLVVSSRAEGRDAVVEISDTGSGLSTEVRGRLFEPFVTTKRTGTGLGLAIVRRVIQAHGGVISATDRPGGGTVFRIVLPSACCDPPLRVLSNLHLPLHSRSNRRRSDAGS
jgi:signal transduction histidine kinase